MNSENRPGELGGTIFMVLTAMISLVVGSIYVLNELEKAQENNVIIWRPHRAVLGIVFISCLSSIIFAPIGGIVEVFLTNKGTMGQAIINSYVGAFACLCIFGY
tara:strand:+ start:294 stop:605 length:312 start_codon:yes stop_codon:yes gene_type:complete